MNLEMALAAFVDGGRAVARSVTGSAYRYEEMASGRRISDVDEVVDRWTPAGRAAVYAFAAATPRGDHGVTVIVVSRTLRYRLLQRCAVRGDHGPSRT